MDDQNVATDVSELDGYGEAVGCAFMPAIGLTAILLFAALVFHWPMWLRALVGAASVMAPALLLAKWLWERPGLRFANGAVMSQSRIRRATVQLLGCYTAFVLFCLVVGVTT